MINYSIVFTTYIINCTRKALIKWILKIGKRNEMVIIISKGYIWELHGQKPRITFT